jgi:anaphase-promoting complex subunit 2
MAEIMTSVVLNARKRRVFDSVFTPAIPHSEPTPELRSTGLGEPFGGPVRRAPRDPLLSPDFGKLGVHSVATAEVRWDRAWHIVTSYLVSILASDELVLDENDHLTDTPSLPEPRDGFQQALKDVVEWNIHVPFSPAREDLKIWYSQRMRSHFLQRVIPNISRIARQRNTGAVLQNTVQVLGRAHRLYHHGISLLVRQLDASTPGVSRGTVQRFRREIHAVVSNAISERHWAAIKTTLVSYTGAILQISENTDVTLPASASSDRQTGEAGVDAARSELLSMVDSLCNVGLGGEKFQVSFSEVMNEAMTTYINRTYTRVWSVAEDENVFLAASVSRRRTAGSSLEDMSLLPRVVNQSSQSHCVIELCDWIENQYARLAVEVLAKLNTSEVAWNDLEKWKEMSVGRLAALRIRELFDIVVSWPNSNGALDDLRAAVTTPQRRLQLTDAFSATLKERLLHPGASTLQILRTYISMIWSFHYLDQSKVLLDRVAYPLQEYLCSREDTVRIIITGLLSDTEDSEGNPIKPGGDKLVELAILLNKGSDQTGQRSDDLLDWDDMDWMPDPVDAGPGYKRSKNADIIGTLIGVLGSQDVFIKEFQNIVAENLLKHEDDFEKEVSKFPTTIWIKKLTSVAKTP